jgi:ribosome-associated protein
MSDKQKESENLINLIKEGIFKVKGKEVVLIDLTTINHTEFNYFIICHGTSNTHTTSVAESVEETVDASSGVKVFHREGYTNGIWVLLDYGDVMVHVFRKDARDFYNLEHLWADAKITTINDVD